MLRTGEGSPPPTRGTQYPFSLSRLLFGITPAYAGNTDDIDNHSIILMDHPRLRGEHKAFKRWVTSEVGSPPPTRGTLPKLLTLYAMRGITPAYAGNTNIRNFINSYHRDHPRLRGEHHCSLSIAPSAGGSPPPTRGTPILGPSVTPSRGITPAYAGNTYEGKIADMQFEDHPRLRGEHYLRRGDILLYEGSPPPTRGTPAV